MDRPIAVLAQQLRPPLQPRHPLHDGIVTFVRSEVSIEPSLYQGQTTGPVVRRPVTREIVAVIV